VSGIDSARPKRNRRLGQAALKIRAFFTLISVS
jgi:hypothetical protein